MERTAMALGLALLGIGLGSYLGSGGSSATALIPAVIGALIAASGWLAWRSKRPTVWRASAIALALVALAGCWRGLAQAGPLLSGEPLERPLAVAAQSAVGLLCALFVVVSALRLGFGPTNPQGNVDGGGLGRAA
jgi:hypothetical protein